MSSELNTELLDTLVRHEGFEPFPYKDSVGKWTIGIGRNLDDVGISRDEAEMLLLHDLQYVISKLQATYPWYENLTIRRKQALINMGFNLGAEGLSKFQNMLKALEEGDYEKAALEALRSKWADQVGNRAKEIAKMIHDG